MFLLFKLYWYFIGTCITTFWVSGPNCILSNCSKWGQLEKKQAGLNEIAHTHVTSHFWADSPTDGCRLFHNLVITAHKIIVSV